MLNPGPLAISQLDAARSVLSRDDPAVASQVVAELLAHTKQQLSISGDSTPEWFEGVVELLLSSHGTHAMEGRIELLLTCVIWFHKEGRSPMGVLAAEKAVEFAQSIESLPLLRRAYNLLGAVHSGTRDITQATFAYVKAYEIARQLNDRVALCSVIGNLAAARNAAGLFEHCVLLNAKVLELGENDPATLSMRASALHNSALASYRLADYEGGLRFIEQAVALSVEPGSQQEAFQRVNLEHTYVKLLVHSGDIPKARERMRLARNYAEMARSGPALLQARLAEVMVDVHDDRVDIGLTRLRPLYVDSKSNEPSRRDVLETMVVGYSRAGRHADARRYYEEYLNLLSKGQTEIAKRQIAALKKAFLAPKGPTESDVAVLPAEVRQFMQSATFSARATEHLESMAILAELRDDATGVHAYRVGRLAALLATASGLSDDRAKAIGMAARLHDLGKLVVPDAVLRRRAKLTEPEIEVMRRHSTAGYLLLADVEHPAFRLAAEIAHAHHEWWDGSEAGYPRRLAGTGIPIESRIAALADVYDALTHERPYKRAWPHAEAVQEIRRLAGRQFDPELCAMFCALVDELHTEHGDALDAYLGQDACSPMVDANRVIDEIIRTVNAQFSTPAS